MALCPAFSLLPELGSDVRVRKAVPLRLLRSESRFRGKARPECLGSQWVVIPIDRSCALLSTFWQPRFYGVCALGQWRVQIGLFAPQPGPVPTDGTVMGAGWCGGYGNLTTNDHAMRTLIQDRPQQQAPGNPYRPLAYSCQSQAESLTGARFLIHGAR